MSPSRLDPDDPANPDVLGARDEVAKYAVVLR